MTMDTVPIRTTMRPHEEIEVGETELVDLARMGLVSEVAGHRVSPGESASNKTPGATGDK
jgi:hypothetical protein